MRFIHAFVLGVMLSAASPAAWALAQEGGAEDAADSRATSFEAAEGAQTEEIPGGGLLVAAYGTIWLLLLGYVISLAFRQANTARDLERLRQDMKAAAKER